jgi:biopolymer transport protein ExbD
MPKVKAARKSTAIDMTAMCDVAFLLLTFFMLTSKFQEKEPVVVSTPSSVSEIKIPEINIMTVLIDKDGKVFFGMDGQEKRIEVLEQVGALYNINFSDKEKKTFSLLTSFGVPVGDLKSYLSMSTEDRDKPVNAKGIPADSTDNQFKNWIQIARKVNMKAKLAIKSDRSTPYKVIKNVMGTLQDLDENRYNLITSLEQPSDK